jgi:hypothetical protein
MVDSSCEDDDRLLDKKTEMLQQLGIDLNTIGPHMQVRQSKCKPNRAWQSVKSSDRRASLLTALDDVFNSSTNSNSKSSTSSSSVPFVSSTATTAAAVTSDDSNQRSDIMCADDVFVDEPVACYTGVLTDGMTDITAEPLTRRSSLSRVSADQQLVYAAADSDTDVADVQAPTIDDMMLYTDAAACDTATAQDVTADAPVQCVISDDQLQLQEQQLQSSVRSQKHVQAKQLLSAATKRLMLVQHAPWWGWVPAVTNGNFNGKSNGRANGETNHIMANKPSYRLATVPTVVTVDKSSTSSTDGALKGCELLWSPGCESILSGPETESECDQLIRINSSSSGGDIVAIVQRIVQFAAKNSSAKQRSTARTSSAKQVQPLPLAVLKLYSKADTTQDTAQQQYTAKAIALTTASEITTALHDLIAGLCGQQACLQACVHAPTGTINSSNTSDNNQQQSQQQQQQYTAFYRVLWQRGKRAVVAHVQCKYPAVLNVGSHLCAVTGDSTAFTVTEVQDSGLEKFTIYKTDQLVKTLHRSFSGKAKRDSYSSGGYNYSGSSERPSTAYSNRADEPRSASNTIQQLYADWCFAGDTTIATTSTTSANTDNTTAVGTSSSSSSNDTLLLWEVHGLQTVEHYKLECATRKLNYETKLNLNLKLSNRPHLSESNTATAVVNSALTLAHPSVTEQAVQELKQQQQQCR